MEMTNISVIGSKDGPAVDERELDLHLDAKGLAPLPERLSVESLNATFVPKWKATTAYLAGYAVLNPSGDVVTAKVDFTSGASYDASNWNLSSSYTTPAQAAGAAAGLAIVFGGL